MPYVQLLYHLVWTTKGREPWIVPRLEPQLHELLRAKARSLGAGVFAIGGMEDHVHLVTTVPPRVSLAQFVGQIKAVSSKRINDGGWLDFSFAWQAEYAAFTLDKKRLPHHIAYVENQKAHHAEGTLIPALERTAETDRPRQVVEKPRRGDVI